MMQEAESLIVLQICPECGTPSSGEYCSVCGEELEPQLPTVSHYLRELLNEFLSLDSKILRTLPALLFRPGFLTKEYLAGRRNRYLLPSRIYMIVAVVMFFLLGNALHKKLMTSDFRSKQNGAALNIEVTGSIPDQQIRQRGDLVTRYVAESLPYVILLGSTPMFALILMLLYRKKQVVYGEHLIFSFHIFAFALLVLLPGIIVDWADLLGIGLLLFAFYLFFAIKRVYRDRGILLVVRFVVSGFSYLALLLIGLGLSVVLSVEYAHLTGQIPTGAEILVP